MKKLLCKIGTYVKDGETKNEYVNVGVVIENNNGSFLLLNPEISLSGLLLRQNLLNLKENKDVRNKVAVSIFDEQVPETRMSPQAPQQILNDDVPL